MQDSLTIAAQRKSGRERLKDHSVRPDRDFDVLLCDLLGLDRAQLYIEDQRLLTPDEAHALEALLVRLEQGEPLAYVRGQEAFWSLELNVTPGVLIPRPDTELLVEVALSALSGRPSARILDLGTGSGAVALALGSERPLDAVMGTDISEDALTLARGNRDRLELSNVSFVRSDWYRNLGDDTFDMIVSNPPYIDYEDPHVASSVRDYEPHDALFSGKLGYEAIETIISGAPARLSPGGQLFFEHGWKQHEHASRLLREQGFEEVVSYRDLAGHYRVTGGRKTSPVSTQGPTQ